MSTPAQSTSPVPTTARATPFRLIYRSHSRIPAAQRRTVLGAIFTEARAANRRAGITGALLITDDFFVQALEGEESAVRDLYERIARDPRHEDLSVVATTTDDPPVFSRWAMAEVSKDGHADIPLLSDVAQGGISEAAPRRTTPDQDQVLRLMRNTIGADTL